MIKTTILTIATLTGLLLVPVGAQNVFGAEVPLSSATLLDNPTVDAKAIPDWVRNNFEWYVNGQIDEKTLLTSMNWMFDNNVMHLSEKAAQEVQVMRNEINDLKQELEEVTIAAIAIPNLIEARKGANESTDSEVELKNLPTRVDVRGWDPVKKQPIVGDADSQLTVDSINDFVDIFNMPDPNMMVCLPAVQNSEQSSCWIRVSQVHAGGTEDTSVDLRDFAQDNLDQFNTDVFNPDILNPDVMKEIESIQEVLDDPNTGQIAVEKLQIQLASADADVLDVSNELQANLDAKASLRERIAELREQITVQSSDPTSSAGYYAGSTTTTTDTLESELEQLEAKLAKYDETTQMLQLELQDAMNKQQQAYQLLSAIIKSNHDTLKAIISNMRG